MKVTENLSVASLSQRLPPGWLLSKEQQPSKQTANVGRRGGEEEEEKEKKIGKKWRAKKKNAKQHGYNTVACKCSIPKWSQPDIDVEYSKYPWSNDTHCLPFPPHLLLLPEQWGGPMGKPKEWGRSPQHLWPLAEERGNLAGYSDFMEGRRNDIA